MRRKSWQRERIYSYILESSLHPTAQQVFQALKKEMPKLSLGNTYRNIRILVEEGRLSSRKFKDGVERFDATTELHYHLVCERCGAVQDLDMPALKGIVRKAQKYSTVPILGHTIQFFGICGQCSRKMNKNKKG